MGNLDKVTNRPYGVAMSAILITAISILIFIGGADVATLGCACLDCKCADCSCDGDGECQCESCESCESCEDGECEDECEKSCK